MSVAYAPEITDDDIDFFGNTLALAIEDEGLDDDEREDVLASFPGEDWEQITNKHGAYFATDDGADALRDWYNVGIRQFVVQRKLRLHCCARMEREKADRGEIAYYDVPDAPGSEELGISPDCLFAYCPFCGRKLKGGRPVREG